jgi:hypothetical protein
VYVTASPDPCTLKADPGNCKVQLTRFYYNSTEAKCKSFFYGGCDGNGNNWKSSDECEANCYKNKPVAKPASVCAGEADPGPCDAIVPRYYFNATEGKCLSFTYGGCGGNNNNWETLNDCQIYCEKKSAHGPDNGGDSGAQGSPPPPERTNVGKDPNVVKPGKCPRYMPHTDDCSTAEQGQTECAGDGVCEGSAKCCQTGCGKRCRDNNVPAQADRGPQGVCPPLGTLKACPTQSTTPINESEESKCHSDMNCATGEKCCPAKSSNQCYTINKCRGQVFMQ